MALITNLSPPAGTPIAADGLITFDVIDPVIEELRVFVWTVFAATGQVELVFDGDNFQPNYSDSAIASTPGGRTFAIRRVSGWPSQPQLRVADYPSPPDITGITDTTAANVGGFTGIFQAKVADELRFKSLQSSDGSVTIVGNANDLDITAPTNTTLVNDALWNAAGDLPYATADNVGAILPLGTALQVLTVNGGATAPEWVTSSTMATDALWDVAGDLSYATGANAGAKLAIGTNGQVLTVNAGATAPEWKTPFTLATDLLWDAAGDLAYGTGADAGARLALGTALQVLQVNAGATAPEWVTASAGTIIATDPLWDVAGDLAYGTGADTGARLALGTALQVLQVNAGATAPEWVTASAGTTVATDTIWDVAGDLAYGTGADTGARLALGTALQVLQVNAGATAPEWAAAAAGGSATPQPGTISEGIVFHIDYNNAASWAPNQATTWTDIIGDVTGTSTALQSKGHLGFTGANEVVDFGVVGATMADLFAGEGTLEVLCNITSDGELSLGKLVDAGDDSVNWSLYTSAESAGFCKITFFHDFNTTGGVWSSTQKIPIGKWVVVSVRYNSDSTFNNPTVYLNGITVGAMTEDTTPSGTALTQAAGVNLTVGSNESLTKTCDARIETVTAWNQAIDVTEVEENARVRFARMNITGHTSAGEILYGLDWNKHAALPPGGQYDYLAMSAGLVPEWRPFAPPVMIYASDMDSPATADAKVNANAPLTVDADNNELKVRAADDTLEEGGLFMLRIPLGATSMDITVTGRAQNASITTAKVVKLVLYERGYVGAIDTWSAAHALDDFDTPVGSELYIETTTTATLASLSLTAGKAYQFQWTRDGPGGGDTHVDDFWLLSILVEYT